METKKEKKKEEELNLKVLRHKEWQTERQLREEDINRNVKELTSELDIHKENKNLTIVNHFNLNYLMNKNPIRILTAGSRSVISLSARPY